MSTAKVEHGRPQGDLGTEGEVIPPIIYIPPKNKQPPSLEADCLVVEANAS